MQTYDRNEPGFPRDGFHGMFEVSITDLRLSWFRLGIEFGDRCVFMDTDGTTAGHSLDALRSVAEFLLCDARGETVVDLDDESADTARLRFIVEDAGCCRLIVTDWISPEEPARLDLRVPTLALGLKLGKAVEDFERMNGGAPKV